MIKTVVLCDMCEKPIPTYTDDDGFECVKLSRTKEWDTRHIFPHLCEECALKIDGILVKFKEGMSYKRELAARNKKINDERRERLGTSG